ncbi:MAG: hypothetical protein Q4F95_15025 [Oscillospiraceae bacterium]|nr:hypothetical protein [Oscillospiraceae bacterium]
MDEHRFELNKINSRIRIIETVEIAYIVAASYLLDPVISIISIFLLLQLPQKDKHMTRIGLMWYAAVTVFCIIKVEEFMSAIGLVIIPCYIVACKCADQNDYLKTLPGYPYFNQNFEASMSSSQISKRNTSPEDKKKARFRLPVIRLRMPQNIREYAIALSLFIIILGGFNLHFANRIICVMEAFELSSALITNNRMMMKVGIFSHIAAVVLLLICGIYNTNPAVYLFLILLYCLQAFVYFKCYRNYIPELRPVEQQNVKMISDAQNIRTQTDKCDRSDIEANRSEPIVQTNKIFINKNELEAIDPGNSSGLNSAHTRTQGQQMEGIYTDNDPFADN